MHSGCNGPLKRKRSTVAAGFEIGFIVVLEGTRGDANTSGTRHRNFAAIRKTKCADPHPIFVFDVHSHKCLKCFEVAEIMSRFLGNEFRPVCAMLGDTSGALISRKSGASEISPNEERVTDVIDLVNNASPARLNDL